MDEHQVRGYVRNQEKFEKGNAVSYIYQTSANTGPIEASSYNALWASVLIYISILEFEMLTAKLSGFSEKRMELPRMIPEVLNDILIFITAGMQQIAEATLIGA